MTLKYGQCVGLEVDLVAKLVSVSEKWLKAGDDLFFFFFFLVFNSSWASVFVKLKPPLKISGSATALGIESFCDSFGNSVYWQKNDGKQTLLQWSA